MGSSYGGISWITLVVVTGCTKLEIFGRSWGTGGANEGGFASSWGQRVTIPAK